MREILFRGRRIDNGEWAYGYLYVTHNGECEIGAYDSKLNIERITSVVDPETVGQYTNIKDKKGRKIFEGDVVIDKYNCEKIGRIGIVLFVPSHSQFELLDPEHPNFVINLGSLKDSLRVVGNVYDNPELLEGEDNDE